MWQYTMKLFKNKRQNIKHIDKLKAKKHGKLQYDCVIYNSFNCTEAPWVLRAGLYKSICISHLLCKLCDCALNPIQLQNFLQKKNA